jgi:hypothetical protein
VDRTLRNVAACVAGAGAALIVARGALGQVYDVRADWSDTANPSGPWSYRAGDALLPHVDAWGPTDWSLPQPAWATGASFGEWFLPAWLRSNGAEQFPHDWVAGDIAVHTYDPANGGPNGEAKLVWTSPVRGVATVGGGVWMGRDIGRANTWTLLHNSVPLTGGTISSGDAFDRAHPFLFSAGSGGAGVLANRDVALGDRLALLLVRIGSAGDFVVVDMTVTVCVGLSVEPEDVLACTAGGNGMFTVTAQGVGALGYQWRRDGQPIPVTGPGSNPTAASPTLVVPIELKTQGAYDCVVTSECGAITSASANLLVCTADFNCDHVANSTDVSDFINQWFTDLQEGTLVTDIDGNGVVNSTDVSEFINRWFEDQARGCGG